MENEEALNGDDARENDALRAKKFAFLKFLFCSALAPTLIYFGQIWDRTDLV